MDTKVDNQIQHTAENPGGLIALAIEKNVDIERLEKLLALKERFDAQQARKSFLKSLSEFQANVPEIQKKKQVKFTTSRGTTSYKYAEIGEIDEAIKVPLSHAGLSKRWEIEERNEDLICTCIISHVEGHSERTSMSSLKDQSGGKNDIQSRASAITYLQRYTLIGALGLTTASDDDDAENEGAAPSQHNGSSPASELPWLNVFDNQGNKTLDGVAVIGDLTAGKVTLAELQAKYRINKTTVEKLQNIKPESKTNSGAQQQPATAKSITEPDPSPFVVPGNWHAKVEKWKTCDDVIATYTDKAATIKANAELAIFFFTEAMKICNSKQGVFAVYTAAKALIDAAPALQKILKTKQAQLTTSTN